MKYPTMLILLPSLRVSGGVEETLRLARAVASQGVRVEIVALWRHAYETAVEDLCVSYVSARRAKKSTAVFYYFFVLLNFYRQIRSRERSDRGRVTLLLTHYTTMPFAWLTRRDQQLACFNQDVEWMFLPEGGRRLMLRKLILNVSRRSKVITSNPYITRKYKECGVSVEVEDAVWADASWLQAPTEAERCVDVVMLLRNGRIKRLDLYLAFLAATLEEPPLRCIAITPEPDIASAVQPLVAKVVFRPSSATMRELYASSSIFLLLSDLEGFGLPPLEAMGSGCVPVCRDSGGVRCYLQGELRSNLVSQEADISYIVKHVRSLLASRARLRALSRASRQAFADGLTEAQNKHVQCAVKVAGFVSRWAVADGEA